VSRFQEGVLSCLPGAQDKFPEIGQSAVGGRLLTA
jgi:hypothetical protein